MVNDFLAPDQRREPLQSTAKLDLSLSSKGGGLGLIRVVVVSFFEGDRFTPVAGIGKPLRYLESRGPWRIG